ncbi:MAG: DUF3131 domain-containing protein [Clostridia bacterium]|nr:DUF3131 domain-containing protein [Clostridia bacterium]
MIYAIIVLSTATVVFGICAVIFKNAYPVVFENFERLVEGIKTVERGGRGLNLSKYRRILKNAQKSISAKDRKDTYSFEKWIVDNYFVVYEALKRVNLRSLPHVQGVPRVYLIAEFFVANEMGKAENFISFVKDLERTVSLDFSEIVALPTALKIAEAVAVVTAAEYSLRFDKEKRELSGKESLNDKTPSYVSFYAEKYEVEDSFLSFVREAKESFVSLQIYLERKTSVAVENIKNVYKVSVLRTYETLCSSNSQLKNTDNYDDLSRPTQIEYLRRISEISNALNVPESAVCESAIFLSRSLKEDVSRVLFDKKLLKNYIEKGKIKREKNRKKPVYIALVFILAGVIGLSPLTLSRTLLDIVFSIVLFICSIKPMELLLKRLFSLAKKPPVFAMGYKKVPENAETVVVVPIYVSGEEGLKSGYEKIRALSFNTSDERVQYCLLVDLPKSREEKTTLDETLLTYAKTLFEKDDRVIVYVRKKSEEDGVFLGKERKRGALLDFFESEISGNTDKFLYCSKKLTGAKFAVILDEDNEILPDTILNSINTFLHPYNADYDLLSYGAKINKYSITTIYSKRYSEDGSVDCYPCYNDFYADVFGEAVFCGKGIIKISSFYRKVLDAFPEKRILSHDIIEGATAKCGSLRQSIFEDAPQNFKADVTRTFRWQRGDVLLLPYLSRRVIDANNEKRSNNISGIYKLIILVNGLEPIRNTLLLALAFLACFAKAYHLLGFLALSTSLPFLIDGLRSLKFGKVRLRYILRDLGRLFSHAFERFFFLPFYAVEGARVFFSTIFGSAFSKKSLINWTPYKNTQKKNGLLAYVRLFAPSKVVMSILGVLSFDPYFLAFAAVYVLYAFIVYKGGTIGIKHDEREQTTLKEVGKATFDFFAKTLVNDLPRDNIQISPKTKQTFMTSPTDVGFYLMSLVCGVELGYISAKIADERIEKTLTRLDSLEKYRGHLYNWYDVETLKPLPPKRISSADSGNFTACMTVVREYFKRKGDEKRALGVKSYLSPDYSFLFDNDKRLLNIAYYVDENRAEGVYDIFESEARLAYYVAISLGIPSEAWFNLGRSFIKDYGNTRLSWGGSLFEYLMPSIFLKPPFYSMQYKSERNAFYIHKKKTGLWGASESCFNAFDAETRYKYELHGNGKLSMKYDLIETVYSPYSACLCLPYSRGEVGEVLREYISLGGFTERGLVESWDGKKIDVYMTHHQGMILAAITNYLCDDAVSELFFAADEMRALRLINAEPYERASGYLKNYKRKEYAEKSLPKVYGDNLSPYATLLTDGAFSSFNTADGESRISLNNLLLSPVYDNPNRLSGRSLVFEKGGVKYDPLSSCSVILGGDSFERIGEEAKEKVKLIPETRGEIRRIRIKGKSDERIDLSYYFDVCLQTPDETHSHRGFYDLFVTSKVSENYAVYRRKNLDNVAVIVKVIGLDDLAINTNKQNVLERNNTFLESRLTVSNDKYPSSGDVVFPCFACKGGVDIKENEEKDVYILTVFAETIDECERIAERYDEERLKYSFDLFDVDKSNIIKETIAENFSKEGAELLYKIFKTPFSEDYLIDDKFDGKYRILYSRKKSSSTIEEALTAVASLKYLSFPAVLHTVEPIIKGLPVEISNEISGSFYYSFGEEVERRVKIPVRKLPKQRGKREGLFSGEGYVREGAYEVESKGENTLRPYSNVICDKSVGAIVTENGGGFSFADNSRGRKFTEWYNDVFLDTPSEDVLIYINGRFYRLNSSSSVCTHYAEKTEFVATIEGIRFALSIYCENGRIVKCVKALGKNARFCVIFGYRFSLDWKESRAVYCKEKDLGRMVLFNKESKMQAVLTLTDGVPFAGESNLLKALKGEPFGFSGGYFGLYVFGLSCENKISSYVCGLYKKEFKSGKKKTNETYLKTNDAYLDLLFNDWLYKQFYDCRFLSRASFYQCGGGYGFRDQLQDSLALLYSSEETVLNHILDCCSHQYVEGDVMHWWHPPRTGVRSLNADDRFFLCYVTSKYIDKTGDAGILNRKTPFITSEPLKEGEISRYEIPTLKRSSESVREHLKRALLSGLDFGEHDLLKVHGGDWNDGLDRIGVMGRGESVWLSEFAYLTVVKCLDYFDGETKNLLLNALSRLKKGINKAFFGDRFIAYYDDEGNPVGHKDGEECSLYLLTQAFAPLSSAVEEEVCFAAINTAKKLYDAEKRILKLFYPPFKESSKYGYIGDYPSGVRENGGQYTHAAVWYARALFDLGLNDEGYEIISSINPLKRCSDERETERYKGEPYVLPADVYSTGECGWTWYTGSAAWYYVTVVESMLGVTFDHGKIKFRPRLPSSMDEAFLRLKLKDTVHLITIKKSIVNKLTVNGVEYKKEYFQPEKREGEVNIVVEYKEKEKNI